jgi:hypothetical protein
MRQFSWRTRMLSWTMPAGSLTHLLLPVDPTYTYFSRIQCSFFRLSQNANCHRLLQDQRSTMGQHYLRDLVDPTPRTQLLRSLPHQLLHPDDRHLINCVAASSAPNFWVRHGIGRRGIRVSFALSLFNSWTISLLTILQRSQRPHS